MARTDRSRSPALAYLRTSSAANVGADKDSDRRQRQAIQTFAKRAGFEIVAEFYDAAVSGADPMAGFRGPARPDRGERRPNCHRRRRQPL
jgi:Resolvase, N terminal domain